MERQIQQMSRQLQELRRLVTQPAIQPSSEPDQPKDPEWYAPPLPKLSRRYETSKDSIWDAPPFLERPPQQSRPRVTPEHDIEGPEIRRFSKKISRPWTTEENELLVELRHQNLLFREIAARLPGRTTAQVVTHWHAVKDRLDKENRFSDGSEKDFGAASPAAQKEETSNESIAGEIHISIAQPQINANNVVQRSFRRSRRKAPSTQSSIPPHDRVPASPLAAAQQPATVSVLETAGGMEQLLDPLDQSSTQSRAEEVREWCKSKIGATNNPRRPYVCQLCGNYWKTEEKVMSHFSKASGCKALLLRRLRKPSKPTDPWTCVRCCQTWPTKAGADSHGAELSSCQPVPTACPTTGEASLYRTSPDREDPEDWPIPPSPAVIIPARPRRRCGPLGASSGAKATSQDNSGTNSTNAPKPLRADAMNDPEHKETNGTNAPEERETNGLNAPKHRETDGTNAPKHQGTNGTTASKHRSCSVKRTLEDMSDQPLANEAPLAKRTKAEEAFAPLPPTAPELEAKSCPSPQLPQTEGIMDRSCASDHLENDLSTGTDLIQTLPKSFMEEAVHLSEDDDDELASLFEDSGASEPATKVSGADPAEVFDEGEKCNTLADAEPPVERHVSSAHDVVVEQEDNIPSPELAASEIQARTSPDDPVEPENFGLDLDDAAIESMIEDPDSFIIESTEVDLDPYPAQLTSYLSPTKPESEDELQKASSPCPVLSENAVMQPKPQPSSSPADTPAPRRRSLGRKALAISLLDTQRPSASPRTPRQRAPTKIADKTSNKSSAKSAASSFKTPVKPASVSKRGSNSSSRKARQSLSAKNNDVQDSPRQKSSAVPKKRKSRLSDMLLPGGDSDDDLL
ncbi:hypothetical protein IWZ03DRAFT_100503 [Phyllosticta citriasiana]|uniref:Myb-like domain-containing protein n=1 Tax=Phyllosticta citriasiana TaxID=595635 RepID=A0ABR1KWB5_9PEZI